MNEVPKDHYAAAIDEHLRARRGSALGLTASDWSAVEEWWSRGVPLWIITSAIDEVFDRPPAGPLLTRGLRYCAPIIEERFATHVRTTVPGAPENAQTGPTEVTKKAAERMSELLGHAERAARERGETAAADLIAAAAEQTLALGAEEGAALEPLFALGRELTKSLRPCLGEERLAVLSREADEALAAHAARMTVAALRTTRERFMNRRIMEIYGIPDAATL